MNVRLEPRGLYSVVTGSHGELNYLKNTLLNWARQYVRGGQDPVRVFRDEGIQLRVLTGALLDLMPGKETEADGLEAYALVEAELLREYQGEAVAAALCAPLGRSIIKAPAGAGKTRIAAAIIACGAQAGICEWVYLVQNRELAAQTAAEFKLLMPLLLEIVGDADVGYHCGSYGTTPREALARAQGVIVDECHGVAARTRAAVLARCSRAVFRCGMSATPLDRQDARNAYVVGLLGPLAYEVRPERLIAEGHLSQGRYHHVQL